MEDSRKLALEIVGILRKCSSKDVAEDVFGEISQIWSQNIVGDEDGDYDTITGENYNEEYDLFLKK